MTQPQHLPEARENAQRTYDRRRARRAADVLANIPPNRWDDRTRQIVLTLATIAAPSRIDDALHAFDGEPADDKIVITSPPPSWADLPELVSAAMNRAELDDLQRCAVCGTQVTPQHAQTLCGSMHLHGSMQQAKACDDLPRHRGSS